MALVLVRGPRRALALDALKIRFELREASLYALRLPRMTLEADTRFACPASFDTTFGQSHVLLGGRGGNLTSECQLVREDDDLTRLRKSRDAPRYASAADMSQRRHRVVEDQSRPAVVQLSLGEEARQS